MALCVMIGMGLLIDAFMGKEGSRPVTYWLSIARCCCAPPVRRAACLLTPATPSRGMFVADQMANLLGLFSTWPSMVTLVYSQRYTADRGMLSGEFYHLSLFALLGMMMMISANNFLTVYLGLELMSLSLYAMVALNRDGGLHRGGDEVLRARRAGLGPAAVRHVDDVRRLRHPGHRAWSPRQSPPAKSSGRC